MGPCVLCNQTKYPDQELPQICDQTQRPVRIWWDTSVWICYDCWAMYRVDALLAPIRFMMESNRQYRDEDQPGD